MSLFKRNLKIKSLLSSFDRMQSETVLSKDQLLDLCDVIINNRALLVNFEKMSIEDANYMLTFLSGAVYALGGEVHKTGPKTFLFAKAEEYIDGTLKQYIEDVT